MTLCCNRLKLYTVARCHDLILDKYIREMYIFGHSIRIRAKWSLISLNIYFIHIFYCRPTTTTTATIHYVSFAVTTAWCACVCVWVNDDTRLISTIPNVIKSNIFLNAKIVHNQRKHPSVHPGRQASKAGAHHPPPPSSSSSSSAVCLSTRQVTLFHDYPRSGQKCPLAKHVSSQSLNWKQQFGNERNPTKIKRYRQGSQVLTGVAFINI